MRVLVAYGSKMGGTQGLAEMLGSDLDELGHDVDVRSAGEVADVARYDAVIVGGALYYFITWHRDARDFVKRHAEALRQRFVWLFSSGPMDESATEKDIPPIKPVRKAMSKVGARGHVTFGGRMGENTKGYAVGDWRDPEHVRSWAEQIHAELTRESAP